MKKERPKVAFRDSRGAITDLLDDVALNSVTLITSKRGAVRGNHFHKKTVQIVYVLSGRLRYYWRPAKGGKVRSVTLKAGELGTSPAGEAHTLVAVSDCSFLTLSQGPRHGKDYEKDTFRCADKLV